MTNTVSPAIVLDPADFPEGVGPYFGIRLHHESEIQRYAATDDLERTRRYARRCLAFGWQRAEICHGVTGAVFETIFP